MLIPRSDSPHFRGCFFFNDTATTEIYTLSLHDALPICGSAKDSPDLRDCDQRGLLGRRCRSEEHTSELQSLRHLVCRLLLVKNKPSDSGPICEIKRLDGDMRNERSTDARSSLAQPIFFKRYPHDGYIPSSLITQPSRK